MASSTSSDQHNDDGILVYTNTPSCNGGGGALGHPKVYLKIGVNNRVVCPYCSLVFIKVPGKGDENAH